MSREAAILGALTSEPTSTEALYERVGYATLARVGLIPYDPRWPDRFTREEQRIRGTLGDRILRLEHVGSTSVPGLVAKPRIDILLVVSDPAEEAS